jgi:hypothetical protein
MSSLRVVLPSTDLPVANVTCIDRSRYIYPTSSKSARSREYPSQVKICRTVVQRRCCITSIRVHVENAGLYVGVLANNGHLLEQLSDDNPRLALIDS